MKPARFTFSIVTPSRNSGPWIRRCVGSVRGQQDVRYEHIIQDAESGDGTPQWLQAQQDLTWDSRPDSGMYEAIGKGWAKAKGDIFSWLNADEQYLPGTLKAVESAFACNPEADCIFGDCIFVDETGEPVAARREIPLRHAYVANGYLYAMSCTLFFRRRLYDGGMLKFDSRYALAADMDLVLGLFENKTRFLHLPEYLSLFGVTSRNQSASKTILDESEHVRNRHGALKARPLRNLVLAGRYVERLLRGCYCRKPVSYQFAANEVPTYESHSASSLGTRFTFESLQKR
ncbi:MAG: glycosyltransferase [Kiritimatiellia bacterium]